MNPILQALMQQAGLVYMGQPSLDFQVDNPMLRLAHDGFACDAQPALVTTSNAGIPSFLSTLIDPKLIDVLVAPMKAAEIAGSEVKKGDWITETAMFTMIESTGETSSYGDYSENGSVGVNANFPQRQSYHYQVMSQWGERELEKAGLARIDWANQINIASVLTLNKFQNKSYFFGVAGLQNYGLLNDPKLSAPIVPTTKAAGGTGWANATGTEVLADITKLYVKLQTQSNGLIDRDTPMTLAMSPVSDGNGMTKVTDFNVSVAEKIAKIYPNMTVKVAPEYSTASGELLQLIVDTLEGQRTVDTAFTEKLRAHPIVVGTSNFKQKKSQGTWGSIIYRPFLIAQMLGV
ncbi:MAG: major capsid family protein [Pseudomonadota bacterium]